MQALQPLVDLVSRVPTRVQVKLMSGYLAIAVLLIAMGAVGLQVLSGVNQRTDNLNKLQRKIEAYRQVQHDITNQLYNVASAFLSPDESTLSSTLRQLNQFGYNIDRLQFVAKDEVELLDRFRQEHDRFTGLVTQVVELIRADRAPEARELQLTQAVPLADRLERLTNQLVNKAETDMVTGIELSNQAYVTSQWVVVGFASGSIVLALILGYAISWSLIGPVTEVGSRLDQIAAGDFSQRVNVVNRDELGALAANVNRMSEELGHLYQQLEAANLAKSRFLAAASHDLRQPLHALNWFVTQLRHEKDPIEKTRLVEQIETATRAMNELFNALLDISKLDAGVLAPTISEFPVEQLLKRITTTFSAAAREKRLRLRIISNDAWVRSDFILLERILLNLVSNAVRCTVKGGVVIGCRRRAGLLRIEVWDTGVGIPENQRQNVFREFYQIGTPEHDRGPGLGLGLAIVDRLCRLLSHPIELKSQLGRGSRFAVTLPLVTARIATQPLPAAIDLAMGKFVVVVDDDTLVLDAMRGVLKSWGCHVLTAKSVSAAIAALTREEQQPDLIISDYRLSDTRTGFEVIAHLRRVIGADVPAFLISGDTAPERLREARASGYYLLHKPVLPMTLRSVVSQVLKDHALQDHAEQRTQPTALRNPLNDRKSPAIPSPALPPQ
jgi:signal transduction histidine kinase/CheY-like chemotaxis protein